MRSNTKELSAMEQIAEYKRAEEEFLQTYVSPIDICKKCAWKQAERACVLPRCFFGIEQANDEPRDDAVKLRKYNATIAEKLRQKAREESRQKKEEKVPSVQSAAFDF